MPDTQVVIQAILVVTQADILANLEAIVVNQAVVILENYLAVEMEIILVNTVPINQTVHSKQAKMNTVRQKSHHHQNQQLKKLFSQEKL